MIDLLSKKAREIMEDINNWTNESIDEPKCMVCGKIITDDVPLRFFNLERNLEIDFHIDCAYDEGVVT
jgi:hypothetical protein